MLFVAVLSFFFSFCMSRGRPLWHWLLFSVCFFLSSAILFTFKTFPHLSPFLYIFLAVFTHTVYVVHLCMCVCACMCAKDEECMIHQESVDVLCFLPKNIWLNMSMDIAVLVPNKDGLSFQESDALILDMWCHSWTKLIQFVVEYVCFSFTR